MLGQRIDLSTRKLNVFKVSEMKLFLSNLNLCTLCGLRVRLGTHLSGFHFDLFLSITCECLLPIWVFFVCMWDIAQFGALLLMMILRCMDCGIDSHWVRLSPSAGVFKGAREHMVPFCSSLVMICLLYTSPSPRDGLLSRMPSSA